MDPLLAGFVQYLTKPPKANPGQADTALRARIAAAVYGTKPKSKGGSDTAATLLTGPSGLANPLPSGSKMLLGV
jgi:hypothetical protein